MAYVNVAEWSCEDVAEWLRGLEYSLVPYVQFFLNNEINGNHLLNLTAEDLEDLHIFKIGHQQLILEAVELLKQLHYSLNSETLQSLSVKLGCKARSLYNDLKLNGPKDHLKTGRQERISTSILTAVSEALTSVKALVSWLDRLPFQHDPLCVKLKKSILKLSIELASTTQRDQFAEKPHCLIKRNSLQIAELCDKFVQDSKDSLILQPASLDIAVVKKKPEDELGIHIKSTYSGVHIIGGIKDQSPARSCNKVERGDEIVQVNYQTVIGWQQKKLVTAMTEHSTELHLTLKKRPRHINILGEVIILRPYRIPSKKVAKKHHKWSDDKLTTSNESECLRDDFDDEDDSAFLPATANHLFGKDNILHKRLFSGHISTIQRRATVSGASPTTLKPSITIEDLVNGIPSVKGCDNFVRSISHDPSNFLISTSNCKTKRISEVLSNERYKEGNKTDVIHSSSEFLSTANSTILNKNLNCDFSSEKNKSPILMLKELPVHEEDFDILECKSLSNQANQLSVVLQKSITDNFEILKSATSISEHQTCFNHAVSNSKFMSTAEKHNIILYDWEGAETEFCGRRPSAHEISNEVAGSKGDEIGPVLLRKASKIETSPLSYDEIKKSVIQDPPTISSYQVVIAGGVPQKCSVSSKDRKGNKKIEQSQPSKIKDSIAAKFGSRCISCKDLGKGDCEGWLYKQRNKKGFINSNIHWVKRWIVLKDHLLYCYRDESDIRAESLISLPGATVSPVADQRSKKFVFKVCQQQITIVFATETQKDLAHWMNKMGLAAIAYDPSKNISDFSVVLSNTFFSETEDSECGGSPTFIKHNQSSEISSYSSSSEYLSEQSFNCNRKTNTTMSDNSKVISSSVFPKIKKYYLSKKEKQLHEYSTDSKKAQLNTMDEDERNCNLYLSFKCSNQAERYLAFQNAKISYNRSFCSDSSYPQIKKSHHFATKESDDSSSFPSHVSESFSIGFQNKNSSPTQTDKQMDEDYDMLTSSLGRQQKHQLAKEITPGLVARMAVSYSNLSQKNTSVVSSKTKNINLKIGAPAPGYVAKISDTFDHLAKTGQPNVINFEKLRTEQISSLSSNNDRTQNFLYKYQKSASESQVSKSFLNLKGSTKSYTPCISPLNSVSLKQHHNPQPEKYVSLLDREYNKVFEGKKVSEHQLKSPNSTNDTSEPSSSHKIMRFFPSQTYNDSSEKFVGAKDQNLKHSSSSLKRSTSIKSSFLHSTIPEISCSNASSYSLSHDSYNSINAVSSSGSYLSDVFTSSEGIENVGFSCVDQIDSEITYSNSLITSSKDDIEKTPETSPYQRSLSNKNCLTESISTDISSPRSSFKFFNSPKFMRKLTSPKLDKKNIFKSKKQAKELKKAEQKESLNQNEKKFFGSPILGRAIFKSPKTEKKIITVSSGVQTDILIPSELPFPNNKQLRDLNRNESLTIAKLSENQVSNTDKNEDDTTASKSSSCSSLNSITSNKQNHSNSIYYFETRIKPQITVSLPIVSDKSNESRSSPSELPRTLLKPMMGISMLSKKRLPSLSGESSISVSSSKSSQDGISKEASVRSEVSMELNGEMTEVVDSFRSVHVSCNPMVPAGSIEIYEASL